MDYEWRATKFWRPLLHLRICLPYIHIETEMLSECFASLTRTYVSLYVHIWKWQFDVRLYDYERRILIRKASKEDSDGKD